MSRTKSQPVRITDAVMQKLKVSAVDAGRTLPAEVEARLKESLERDAWSEVEGRLTPQAVALGRLVGFLANELAAYSPPGRDKEFVREGIARLLARLEGAKQKEQPTSSEAAIMVDFYFLRMANAHERTYEQASAVPLSAEQTVLAQIREILMPSTKAKVLASSNKELQ